MYLKLQRLQQRFSPRSPSSEAPVCLSTPARGWAHPTAADSRDLVRRRRPSAFVGTSTAVPLGHSTEPVPLATWTACTTTLSARASCSSASASAPPTPTILSSQRSFLVDRSAALHSFGLRFAVRASSPSAASVLSFFPFAPSRCSISPIEPDLFAPGLLYSARSALLRLHCLLVAVVLVVVVVFDSYVQNLLMRVCELSFFLESLLHTPGTIRQGQLLCDTPRI